MKVLIALDDSPFSKEIINSILNRPWPPNTTFKILHVLEPMCIAPADYNPGELEESLNKVTDLRLHAAEKLCNHTLAQLTKSFPDLEISSEIRQGRAKTEIVDAAVEWKADKILIGAHGREICPHNLIGSVSRTVVNAAPCSVEVVRTHAKKAK